MNIEKQIRNLYIYEVISGLQIVDLVWVFFLLQRGFSLFEAGAAEGVFHTVSMCCEIPSGMIADMLGRKKTLVLAGFLASVSAAAMICTEYFPVILLAMGINALNYNMVSGTREALTYDSLLEAGCEEKYLQVSARQEMLYSGLRAVTGLLTIVTVGLGYRIAYLLAIVQGLTCAVAAGRLKEAHIHREEERRKITGRVLAQEFVGHFKKSFSLLKGNRLVRKRMSVEAVLLSGCYLICMILQEHLIVCGLPERLIGIPLLLVSAAEMGGAAVAAKTGSIELKRIIKAAGLGVAVCICLTGSRSVIFAVVAAAGAGALCEICTVRLENENQKAFASEVRATMISVGSMVYSIYMAVLSPVVGGLSRYIGVSGSFLLLGAVVGASVLLINVDTKDS